MKRSITIFIFIIPFSFILSSCGFISEKNTEKKKTPTVEYAFRAGNANGNRFYVNQKRDTLFNGRIFHNAYEFKKGYAVVSLKIDGIEKRGVINLKGEEVIPIHFTENIGNYDNGYFEIRNEEYKRGLIDTLGNVLIKPQYRKMNSVRNNMVKVQNEKWKWGIVNLKGEKVVDFKYYYISRWDADRAVIQSDRGGKYGYINLQGEEIIPQMYSLARCFEEGIALVKKDHKIGFIDPNNNIIIDFQYEAYKQIVDNYKSDVDQSGFYQTNHRFSMKEGYIILKKNNKWGYINRKGEIIVPFEYDDVSLPDNIGLVRVVKNNKKGYYQIKEKSVTWDS